MNELTRSIFKDIKIKINEHESKSKLKLTDIQKIKLNNFISDRQITNTKDSNEFMEEKIVCPESRIANVEEANYNPFTLSSGDVDIDLLTDSGTSKLFENQKYFKKDCEEKIGSMKTYAYARPIPKELLNLTMSDMFGDNFNFYLTVQGRASEFLIMQALLEIKKLKEGDTILSNRPFDTTKGHINNVKVDVKSLTPMATPQSFWSANNVFLGNLPEDKFKLLGTDSYQVGLITITDNGGGGQPVSMKNIKAMKDIVHKQGKIFWIDGCRIFENALFIKAYEKGYEDKSINEIVKEMVDNVDVVTLSFKKIYSHSGGAILINKNSKMFSKEEINVMDTTIKRLTTIFYGNGFNSYSGKTGRDILEMITGLITASNIDRLIARIGQTSTVGHYLKKNYNLPVFAGGHALYLAADQILPNIPKENCPAEYLNAILMAALGIRGCGLGYIVYAGARTGKEGRVIFENDTLEMDSLRLAIPRHQYYTQELINRLAILGKAYKQGVFEKAKAGLIANDFQNTGFYHFEGKYSAKDKAEFKMLVKEVQKFFN